MSITEKIKAIAQEKLERSEFIGLFSNTPVGKPFLGDVKSCEYFSGGYEVPINVKYGDKDIGIGNCILSKDGKECCLPDEDLVLRIFKGTVKMLLEDQEKESLDKVVVAYQTFKKNTNITLDFLGYESYEQFKEGVKKGTAPDHIIEYFTDLMIHSLHHLDPRLITSIDPCSLKLDVFPEILVNYALQDRIKEKRIDKAVDILVSLNHCHEETVKIIEERLRREREDDIPVYSEPIFMKVSQGNEEEMHSFDVIMQSNKDVKMEQERIDKSVKENLRILRSLAVYAEDLLEMEVSKYKTEE